MQRSLLCGVFVLEQPNVTIREMDWRGDEELSKEEGASHISPLSRLKGFRIYRILVHSLFWIIAKLTCPIDRRATFCRDDALCGIDPAICR